MEDHPAFEGRVTARLARRLVKDARAMTVSSAARRHGVGWKLVNALVVAYAGLVGDRRRRQRCRVLLVEAGGAEAPGSSPGASPLMPAVAVFAVATQPLPTTVVRSAISSAIVRTIRSSSDSDRFS
ncbi:transposase family protein [Candidatus Poriferisodalis sp.]|uniref:transposase family protein n=1 Tax=Candidatus Poriferisodalis sp. TaxID=3101277 RepID=UPI003C6F357D